jgi:hypothetical protein
VPSCNARTAGYTDKWFGAEDAMIKRGVPDGILWPLCGDLLARGKLGLEEAFIDVSFAGTRRMIALVEHTVAKGARSRQSRTAIVFLSPQSQAWLPQLWGNR